MGSVSRALVAVVVLAGVTTHAEAQSTETLVSAASAEVSAALAAGSCLPQATELASASTRLRGEADALLLRALTSYVTTLRTQLATCMGPTRADPGTAPRGRFAASADDADESGRGSFDMQQVVRIINTRRAAITRCYERQLVLDATLAGRVRVSMTILESGSVTDVRALENTTGSDAVATCVVAVVRGFRFNPGPADGSVTYAFPFTFSRAD